MATELTWDSPLKSLYEKQVPKSCQNLTDSGVSTLRDLLWILPLKVTKKPELSSFASMREGSLFKGRGKIISTQIKPNFSAKGRKGALLHNVTLHVQDLYSQNVVSIKWFNAYGSIKSKVEKLEHIEFSGPVSIFNGQKQVSNPDIKGIYDDEISTELPKSSSRIHDLTVKYPTINSTTGTNLNRIIAKIPAELWENIDEPLPSVITNARNLISLRDAFNILHARQYGDLMWSEENEARARDRLIYQEFFEEQLKISLRRKQIKSPDAPILHTSANDRAEILKIFPFTLTQDQHKALEDINNDLSSGKPMMRLIQGDVGCGKTAVAIASALSVCRHDKQVALMCPTESLALQHYVELKSLTDSLNVKSALLLGSTTSKEKQDIYDKLKSGDIDFIVGTHSLIQDRVEFKALSLAIIDEQHKFGVGQRIRLSEKGIGCHCLIMTATPIPRSLSLTQYGDLDITTIKTMPSGRKGHKTRIINPTNFEQFLSFFSTRLSMKEQAYVTVPAITENEGQNFLALEKVLERFRHFFPDYRIECIHGKLKPDEKSGAFMRFKEHKTDILIATSVIEVGINVPNATIMAIMNPERFGLSSLHQLRGRVGRGQKPGFCFLVNDRSISPDGMHRLKVIENHTDGFIIAEEDLKIRGEGDIFGKEQSGSVISRKLASIILHPHVLRQAKTDTEKLLSEEDPQTLNLMATLSQDPLVFATV